MVAASGSGSGVVTSRAVVNVTATATGVGSGAVAGAARVAATATGSGTSAVVAEEAVVEPLSFTDDFNQADGTLDTTTKYDYYTISPYLNLPPVVISNQVRAADPGGTNGNTVFGMTAPKFALNFANHKVEFDLTGTPGSVAQCGLIARMTDDMTQSIQLNVVNASHGGISDQQNLTATNHTSYDQSMVASGDRLGIEVHGDQYVAYRIRSGIRLNITAYQDTGGALVPLTAKRYGFYAISTRSGGVTYYGATFDNFAAYDLPDRVSGDFIETAVMKNTSSQTWPVSSSGWVQLAGLVTHPLYPGSTVSSDSAVVRGNKTGANIIATVPFTGGTLNNRQHKIRVKKNGTQIGSESSVVTGNSGTCTVSTTSNVVDGDLITVEMACTSHTSGAGNTEASLASITIT